MRILTIMFILVFLTPIMILASNGSQLPNIQGEDNTGLQGGRGYFNNINMPNPSADSTEKTAAITGTQVPLVADLNGDGINEFIAVGTDGTVSIFNGFSTSTTTGYDLTANFNMSTDFGTGSDFLIFDVDNDDDLDIITWEGGGTNYQIGTFNGTHLFTTATNTTGTIRDIQCRSYDGMCIALLDGRESCDETGPGFDKAYISGMAFNTSNHTGSQQLYEGSTLSVMCWSSKRGIGVENFDGAIWEEFYAPYATHDGTPTVGVMVIALDGDTMAMTATPLYGNIGAIDYSGNGNCFVADNSRNCGNVRSYFSGVTSGLYDFDNVKDMAVAYRPTDETFKVAVVDGDGSSTAWTYSLTGDATKISNPIFGTFFPDSSTQGRDVCVLGYDHWDGATKTMEAYCVSQTRPLLFTDYERFIEDISDSSFNLSSNKEHWTAYGAQMISTRQSNENVDLDDFVTPYGVFMIDFTSTNDLDRIYPLDEGSGSFAPVGITQIYNDEGESRLQLVGSTATNAYLINDEYVNAQAYIKNGTTIDPCTSGTWSFNTSVEVKIRGDDPEGDHVSARAQLYYDTSNEQDSGWTENVSTADGYVQITIEGFYANKSTSGSTLRLSIRDTDNNFDTTPDYVDETFTVYTGNTTGLVLGDCVTSVGSTGEDVVPGIEPDVYECTTTAECVSLYGSEYYCYDTHCYTDGTNPGIRLRQ